ncbi:hypothetical protein ASZ90_002414 [hydrocarbon metagenome]|uniref:Uncharacterized protein n=1 Tax=hydrocarbon metagenome TaxID=938273 RepID=A0A0W8G436_9ZZZZ
MRLDWRLCGRWGGAPGDVREGSSPQRSEKEKTGSKTPHCEKRSPMPARIGQAMEKGKFFATPARCTSRARAAT